MSRRAARGFTLLEVLVALAIVAVVMVALMRTAGMGATALWHFKRAQHPQFVIQPARRGMVAACI